MYIWTDGSELYHHGIKGQKWGIRRFQNKDGSYTDEGKVRYGRVSDRQIEKMRDAIKNSPYGYDYSDKVFKIANADQRALSDARNVILGWKKEHEKISNEVLDLFKEFNGDDGRPDQYSKAMVPYEVVSEIAYGINYDPSWSTLEDYANAAYMSIWEDGQQGPINAYSLYAYDNDLWDEVGRFYDRNQKNDGEMRSAAVAIVDRALDEVGAGNISAYTNNPKYLIGKAVVNSMADDAERKSDDYGISVMYDAYNQKSFNNKTRKIIENVRKNVSKIANNDDKNTWNYFYEAVENLGMLKQRADDLSDSDWDKINAEIRELRKKDG